MLGLHHKASIFITKLIIKINCFVCCWLHQICTKFLFCFKFIYNFDFVFFWLSNFNFSVCVFGSLYHTTTTTNNCEMFFIHQIYIFFNLLLLTKKINNKLIFEFKLKFRSGYDLEAYVVSFISFRLSLVWFEIFFF